MGEYKFTELQSLDLGGDDHLVVLGGPGAASALVRSYSSGLITLTLEYFKVSAHHSLDRRIKSLIAGGL